MRRAAPLALAALTALLAACAGEGASAPIATPALPPAADPAPAPSTRLALATPPGAEPIVWVRSGERVALRTAPAGGELVERLGRRTEFASATVLGVVRRHGRWAGVTTPLLPNGRLGWVRLDRRRLAAGWTRLAIEVDLSERRAVLRNDRRVLRSFTVTVGAPGSETPTGRFAVTDIFRDGLSPAYGCCALAISATQPRLPSGWMGGRRIAIHGNGGGGPLGVAASHGCVRAGDPDVRALIERVPLGTPVVVRA